MIGGEMESLLSVCIGFAFLCFGTAIVFFILWVDEKEYSDLLERINKDFVKRWIEWEKGPKMTESGIPIPPPVMLGVDRF